MKHATQPIPVESDVSMDGEFELLRGLQCGVSVLQARQTDAVSYFTLHCAHLLFIGTFYVLEIVHVLL